MVQKKSAARTVSQVLLVLLTVITHWVVFYFVIVNSAKTNQEASLLSLSLPKSFEFFKNLKYVVSYRKYAFLHAFWNSFEVTVISIGIIVAVSSMASFFLQRRKSLKFCRVSDKIIVACMTIPASVVTTYYVLNILHVANTLTGLVLVEVASLFPFCTMMYKGFVATIPKEIDEAAILDGCGSFSLFWRIIFPILRPVTASIVVLRSIIVFNDFQNAMYYLSGSKSMTIQVCVFSFKSAFGTKWAYLFMASLLASLPLLILYAFLNRQILEGMTTGAVKG